ncbi:hypothetical protein OF846_000882 [Rhodotorula toruloides]|nr:hypothetical protein OF846_000882 [Rhodotorula toruloides]
MPYMILKVTHDTKPKPITRLLPLTSCPTWSALTQKIATRFQLTVPPIALTYSDDDDDEITLSSDIELEELWLAALPTILKLERDSGTKDDAACVKMQIVLPWQQEQARDVKLESVSGSVSGSVSPLLQRNTQTPAGFAPPPPRNCQSTSPTTPKQRNAPSEPAKTPDAPFRGVSWQDGGTDAPAVDEKPHPHASQHACSRAQPDGAEHLGAENPAAAPTSPAHSTSPPAPLPRTLSPQRSYSSDSSGTG